MAMAFTFRVMENAARNYILQVVGVDVASTTAATADGSTTGIVAANGYTPTTHFKVRRILYDTTNCVARIQWHATSNVDLAVLSGYGDFNLTDKAGSNPMGIWDDGGVGVTGDIDISSSAIATVATGGGVTASITLVFFCIKGA